MKYRVNPLTSQLDKVSDAISDITGLQTALDAKEPTISAGTTAQYWRGDKSWQTLDKSAVGLGNVDNTSDVNKPISTATQTALDLKLNTSSFVASGSTGYIQFNSGGAFSSDSNLFWDDTNNRLGIGTTSPQQSLHIVKNGNAQAYMRFSNTTDGVNAIAGVQIEGQFSDFGFYAHAASRTIARYGITVGGYSEITVSNLTSNTNGLLIGTATRNKPIIFGNNNLERMRIDAGGNIGIATASPSEMLDINSGWVRCSTNYGIKWAGGSQLYEQGTRMLYQPNGDRFEVLTESGAAFICGFHGPASSLANSIRLYSAVGIGNAAGYAVSGTLPANGLAVLGSVGIGVTSPGGKMHIQSATTTQTTAVFQAIASQTATIFETQNSGGTKQFAITSNGRDFELDTTTGSKIGTATTQKLGFWNATPIVQPTTAVAAATFAANTSGIADDTATFDGYTIGQVVKALRNEGLLA